MPLLYEQVADRIRQGIRSGEHGPGSQLSTEAQYAEAFGVSRITIKRAMSTLERQGLIERFRGRGTFVTQGAPQILAARTATAPEDPAAQKRARQDRRRIGFIIPEISDLFGVRMVNGIDDRCQELDIDLCIRRSHGTIELEAKTVETWVASGMDGIIVFPCHGEFYNEALLRAVLGKFPVVLVDRTLNGIPVPSVQTDNYTAARDLTAWLMDQGHRTIAFASPQVRGTSSLEDRLNGFTDALHESAEEISARPLHLRLDSVLPGHMSEESTLRDRAYAATFLRDQPDVTAVLASEYSLALLLDSVIAEDAELRERAITVACFDSFSPAMSVRRFPHIAQDEVSMGRRAVDLIVSQLDGESPVGREYVAFTLQTET